MKKFLQPIIIAMLCILCVASADAQAQVRVAGFKPSTSGFHFPNKFPPIPYTINVAGINMPIGNASNGMCGGMVYATRDYFEAGHQPPPDVTPPSGGPLYTHLSHRLFDSFNLPGGPLTYLHLMNPDLPDHETWLSNAGLAPRGRAWVMIMQEWPKIKADLDQGRLSPMALIRVKDHDPFKMGQNHQVLAYGYTLNGNDLVINVYDPNYPGSDNVTISLNIGDPQHTTDVHYSDGGPVFCFFQPGYTYVEPPSASPIGWLDGIDSNGNASGWTLDPDLGSQAIAVHFYVDGPAGGGGTFAGQTTANLSRPDVNQVTGYIGNHGFSFTLPAQYKDGLNHKLYVYGIDATGNPNVPLSGVPKVFYIPFSNNLTISVTSVSRTTTTETIIVNARNASTGASVNGTVTLNGHQTFQTGLPFTITTMVRTCDPELRPPCRYERVFNDLTVTAPGYNPVTFIR